MDVERVPQWKVPWRDLWQREEFERRLKVIPAYWLYCDECGRDAEEQTGEQLRYVIGVSNREVQLCLSCALALHDEGERRGIRVEHILLERYG